MAYMKLGGINDLSSILHGKFKSKHDDDLIDRLNYIYTPSMLAIFAGLVAVKQYVGEPLQCWIPAQFKSPWESYSEKYCFVENTYFVGLDEDLFPRTLQEREDRELLYYQWVPIMLCIQLVLFLVPKTIWSSLNWRTGLTVTSMVDSTRLYVKDKDKKTLKDTEKTKEDSNSVSDYIYQMVKYNTSKHKVTNYEWFGLMRLFNGNYVTILYLFFKFLNCVNTILQLIILNKFLGPQYSLWGWGIAADLWNGRQWHQSGHFPRITYCDVQIREIGQNIHTHTFQCVLMINMFNEKIYILIWFWFFFLAILNLVNFFIWVYYCTESANKDFLHKHLRYKEVTKEHLEKTGFSDAPCKNGFRFYGDLLYRDVVTLLRLLAANCTDLAASEVIKNLHDSHLEDIEDREKSQAQKRLSDASSGTGYSTIGKNGDLPDGLGGFTNPNMNGSMISHSTDTTSMASSSTAGSI